MSEGISLSSYDEHVVNSRFSPDIDRDWEMTYSQYLDAESLEMIAQHGDGMILLMPLDTEQHGNFWPNPEDKLSLQYGMADEMGDILWFVFDVASHSQLSVSEVCKAALTELNIKVDRPIESFSDIEEYAVAHADEIKVSTKAGLMFEDLPPQHRQTSLSQNPQYLYVRTARRLSRSLDRGARDLAPFTASELETPLEVEQALGTYLLVLAYIAREKLEVSLDEIAQFNMAKLIHRQQFGKKFDLKFAAWKHMQESKSS